jgi:hypothetical protein
MSPKVYFDTDCFHHFAKTFENRPLAEDLRGKILLSPVTMIETLAHLSREWGDQVLRQIQGMRNWLNPSHIPVLPFMDEAISMIGFGARLTEDGYTQHLQNDINVCSVAELSELQAISQSRADEVKKIKESYAGAFQDVVTHFRSNPLTLEAFTELWLGRFRVNDAAKDHPQTDSHLVTAFSALREFDYEKLKNALVNPTYNALKHANDLFDAEQLIYLGDENLHFITVDKGYLLKVLKSPQKTRIHQVLGSELDDPASAENLLRRIVSTSRG